MRRYLDGLQLTDAGVIVDTISAGQASGCFRREAKADRLAEMVLSMIDGLALHHELDSAGMNLCAGTGDLVDLVVDGL